MRLALLSRTAALHVPGVVATDPGPAHRFLTAGDGQRVDGIRCVAAGGGGFEVSLRLRCELVPLREVGEAVRTAVARAAAIAGVTLAEVNVLIADVVEAGLA